MLIPDDTDNAKTPDNVETIEHIDSHQAISFPRYRNKVIDNIEYVKLLSNVTKIIFTFEKGLFAILEEVDGEVVFHALPDRGHIACHYCGEKQESPSLYKVNHGTVICHKCIILCLGLCVNGAKFLRNAPISPSKDICIIRCHCCAKTPNQASHIVRLNTLNLCSDCLRGSWEALAAISNMPKVLNIDARHLDDYWHSTYSQ